MKSLEKLITKFLFKKSKRIFVLYSNHRKEYLWPYFFDEVNAWAHVKDPRVVNEDYEVREFIEAPQDSKGGK